MKLSIVLLAFFGVGEGYRRDRPNYRYRPNYRSRGRARGKLMHLDDLVKDIDNAQAELEANRIAIRKLEEMKKIVATYQ